VKAGTIVDTGPLVAFLNRRDGLHEWSTEKFAGLSPPLLTCEAVLSEACFLMAGYPGGTSSVLRLLRQGGVRIAFRMGEEADALDALLSKYASVPMSLADACLVRMSELSPKARVLTTDRHFAIYRRHGRQVIPVILPPKA